MVRWKEVRAFAGWERLPAYIQHGIDNLSMAHQKIPRFSFISLLIEAGEFDL